MSNKYVQCRFHGKKDYLHRARWVDNHGPIPAGWQVHHINGDRRDNRIENLICLPEMDHEAVHKGDVIERDEIISKYREHWSR